MKKITLITIIGLLALVSCDQMDGEKLNRGESKSFVVEYYSISGLYLLKYPSICRDVEYCIVLQTVQDGNTYGTLSKEEVEIAKYQAKCAQHGDNGYKQRFRYASWWPTEYAFHDRDFTAIKIVSNANWDAAHPAGTSLNDLFYFASSSPIEFIRRRYIDPYQWGHSSNPPLPNYYKDYLGKTTVQQMVGYEPVFGLVSELTAADLVLLGGGSSRGSSQIMATLTPIKKPELAKRHFIRITLTDTNGHELTETIDFNY